VIVYRFIPQHRQGSRDLVSIDATPQQARSSYRQRRQSGERAFVARLCTIGLWADEVRPAEVQP
jgi:hypothetical protein